MMSRTTYIYHERQLGALCGVHCVNNLLQGPRFGPGDLAEIGVRLDKKERRLLGKNGRGSLGNCSSDEAGASCNFDGSADGGNFSIQVLSIALARAGLKLLPTDHPEGRELMVTDGAHAAGGFMVQRHDHWYALRAVGPCWWDLDSLLPRPKPLDKRALSARLRRLTTGGHSTFLVIGDLPVPHPPPSGARGGTQINNAIVGEQATLPCSSGLEESDGGGSSWHEASGLLVASRQRTSPERMRMDATNAGEFDDRGTVSTEYNCLKDFCEREVQAALFLTDQNHQRAAEVLKKARESVEYLNGASPQRLANALSAAVGAVLQARRSLPVAIARLVALLCAPGPSALVAAAELIDCGELAHDLLTALTKKARGWLWTDGLMQAATVAVDLLLDLPAASVAAAASRDAGVDFEAPESGSDGEPAPLELPSPGAMSPTPSSDKRPAARHPEQVVNGTIEFDFSTSALDALLDTVACEGLLPGKPLISSFGLKVVTSTSGVDAHNRESSAGVFSKRRSRGRPSAKRPHSQRRPP